MGPYIMDHFIDRERVKGLMVMAKAFVQLFLILCDVVIEPFFFCSFAAPPPSSYKTLTLQFLQKTLAFDTLEDARTFLVDHKVGSFFTNPKSPDSEKVVDCKSALQELNKVYEEKYRKVAIRGAI